MTVEGAVAIAAGIVAGSIALIGFGLDSAIEGVASVIIIWRFTGPAFLPRCRRARPEAGRDPVLRPRALRRLRVGQTLVAGEHADVSWVGIGLAIGSLIVMPLLGIAKPRFAEQLGSAATKGEGRQNMLCAYLAGALLVGLLGNALRVPGGWTRGWAADRRASPSRKDVEAWRGEGCCITRRSTASRTTATANPAAAPTSATSDDAR